MGLCMLVYRLLRVIFLFGECDRGLQGKIFFYTCLRETLGDEGSASLECLAEVMTGCLCYVRACILILCVSNVSIEH